MNIGLVQTNVRHTGQLSKRRLEGETCMSSIKNDYGDQSAFITARVSAQRIFTFAGNLNRRTVSRVAPAAFAVEVLAPVLLRVVLQVVVACLPS